MKTLTLNLIQSKFTLILFVLFNIFSVDTEAQNDVNTDKNSTMVYASSLREMFVSETDDDTYVFEIAIAGYYNIKLSKVINDPELKSKLIYGIVEDMKKNGYELPRKKKNRDFFEPYKFILDLPVYYNMSGYIIPVDKVGDGHTTSVVK